MNVALLNYTFLFDPAETWPQLSQFESDLNFFLNEKGMEARVIQPIGAGNKIIHITKKEELDEPNEPKMIKGNTGFAIRAKGKTNLEVKKYG